MPRDHETTSAKQTEAKDEIQIWLEALSFQQGLSGQEWLRSFPTVNCELVVDCGKGRFLYEEAGITVSSATTANFSLPENFVVFECVCRLLEKGYKPKDIELEPQWKLGHTDKGGRADIWVRTTDRSGKKQSLLIIECKTAGREFDAAWRDTLADGAQLFSYFQQERGTRFLCLYSSRPDGSGIQSDYRLVRVEDNKEYLQSLHKPKTYADARNNAALFAVWRDTYQQESATRGLFEPDIAPYHPGKTKYAAADLRELDHDSMQSKYHEFATILRQHNVSGHENAFDKLVNLFLAKVVDEKRNPENLLFHWKGIAYDTPYDLQDRLQQLYTIGMKEFLGEVVTYIDEKAIRKAFGRFERDPDATKSAILDYFRQLKFYTNNDFAFLDVHNERLFVENFAILLKIVQMLEDIRLRTDTPNQFLGDLFEGFLDRGIKQSEGQFFTPLPIVRFIVSSLPLRELVRNPAEPPRVIDYACGAGHFLNEYARQVKPFIAGASSGTEREHLASIVGVEKEYRLSKVAKVAAFMYGEEDIRIVYADALAKNTSLPEGAFDVLVSNPPYSVKGFLKTLSEEDRGRYDLSTLVAVKQGSTLNAIECFFVERAAQLLKPCGLAAVILPSSILSNGNAVYVRAREILFETFEIVSLAEFGSGTFGKTGTNTVVAFLRKRDAPPDFAEHCRNRATAWLSAEHKGDEVFGDAAALDRYCIRRRLIPADYRAFLAAQSPAEAPASVMESDAFRAFRADFAKKNAKKKWNSTERAAAEWAAIRETERDRLTCFLLADANPVPVLLVKMPAESKASKAFLGYEWSGRKGQEGIKSLGTATAVDFEGEDEDDSLARAKGIDAIRTPLFDPAALDRDDIEKLNALVRKNFLGILADVPESIRPFARRIPLADMLDFDAPAFDKQLRTGVSERTEILSDFPLVRLGEVSETIGGLWTGKKPPFSRVRVIRNTNFTLSGALDLKNVAELEVETSAYAKRKLEMGDIIVEKSGGSETQAVGRVVYFDLSEGKYSFSNFTTRLRIIDKRLNPKFVYLVLHHIWQLGMTFSLQHGSSGLKNLDLDKYLALRIPLPPSSLQTTVVEECESVDADCEAAMATITKAKSGISKLMRDAKGSSRKLSSLCCAINPPKSEIAHLAPETIISFVGMASVSDNGFIERREEKILAEVASGSYTYFAEGDILLAKITPCMENGKCAIATDLTNGIGFGSSEFHVLRTNKDCEAKYLFSWLNREEIRIAAAQRMTGASGHRRVPISFYEELEIPLPPLSEQKRIVEQLRALEQEISSANAILSDAPARKRAILAAHGVIR